MRGMVFTTGTPDTIKLVRSFQSLGHETQVVQYDASPASGQNHVDMLACVTAWKPDVIVYIGAIKTIHHSWVPSTQELCEINHIAPMIHICSDAADTPWHQSLEEYNAAGAFALQVAIDGSLDSPLGRFGMVALTPVHHEWFPENPSYGNRSVHCGFAGGVGCRIDILSVIQQHGMLTHYGNGGHAGLYEDLCKFYTACRTVVNDARTGSMARRHIKGRFVEAGMAGAVVLEPADSPAREWFKEGEEFLTWQNPQEAVELIRQADPQLLRYEEMGRRIRARMIEEHSAPVFWREVFRRIGL
jgi:Glycosyl transferases group 1